MTTKALNQLIYEFRQLQLEVTELKVAGKSMEEAKDEEGSFRYQLYFGRYFELEAR